MSLVYEWFAAKTVIGGGLLREVEEIAMHFVVTCDDDASVSTGKSVAHREGCGTSASFILNVTS